MTAAPPPVKDESASTFYRDVIGALTAARVPFLVGGTFAVTAYTGIVRATKDLDLFLRREDWSRARRALAGAGIAAELVFPHWLGKARRGPHVVDLIHNGGNGLTAVDDEWFPRAAAAVIEDVPVRLVPPEEMIWSKAFVMERERFDGADVQHILRARHASLDWRRLIARFGDHRRVLLSHLVLFGFVYPHDGDRVPPWVLDELWAAARAERPPAPRVCRGTLLSREQYLADVADGRCRDPRLQPLGPMTAAELETWTAAIAPASDHAPHETPPHAETAEP